MLCVNKNSREYQTLKDKSGISESLLYPICRGFLDRYGRFPYLDELPNADSELHLRNNLKIKNNSVEIQRVLDATGSSSIENAVVSINNEYRDLETSIIPIVNKAIVDIKHRPTTNNTNSIEVELDENVNDFALFTDIIDKLQTLYGINVHPITSSELNSPEWKQRVPDALVVNAFVYNGEIYINLDNASADAKVHEMMHLLIGGLRFSNSNLYSSMINSVQLWDNYEALVMQFNNRTRNDIHEELFITEVSKFLSGLPSHIDSMSNNIKYEIYYNVSRMLDTILMGQDSSKTMSSSILFQMSLKNAAKVLNSVALKNNFKGTFNTEGSELHRKLNNQKQLLLKSGELVELCN